MKSHIEVLLVSDATRADRELVREIHLLIGSQQFTLKGLYIEDEDLMRASALPGAVEISFAGEIRQLTQDRLREDLLRTAQSLQETLDTAAAEHGYPNTFEVVKGSHAVELQRAAAGVDFVVVARPALPGSVRTRGGLQLEPLIAEHKTLLLVNEPWLSGRCVVVAYQGEKSLPSLRLGARYAASAGLELIVVAPSGTPRPDGPEAQQVSWIDLQGDEDELANICQRSDARLLIVAQSDGLPLLSILPKLMDRVPCSILRLAGDG